MCIHSFKKNITVAYFDWSQIISPFGCIHTWCMPPKEKTVHTFPCVCQGNHIKLFVSLSRYKRRGLFGKRSESFMNLHGCVCPKGHNNKMNWPLFDSHRQLPLEATLGLDGLLIYWGAYQGRQGNRYTARFGSEKRASRKIYNLVASWFISKPQKIHLWYKHFKETIGSQPLLGPADRNLGQQFSAICWDLKNDKRSFTYLSVYTTAYMDKK